MNSNVTSKRVTILRPGAEVPEPLDHVPSWTEIQKLIGGGLVEPVTVLDRIEPADIRRPNGNWIYTRMFVDEEGLIKELPRNELATEIYLRNARAQFPNHPNPSKAIMDAARARYEALGAVVVSSTPPGFDDDPYISGIAVMFDGYSILEVDELLDKEGNR